MRNFRELSVWKSSMDLVTKVYQISVLLPDVEKYGLQRQIQRCAVSIPSNIAEGCSRSSEKEFKHFLEIAIGSAFELETQLLLIQNLNLINNTKIEPILNHITQIQRMLNNFIVLIKKRIDAHNL